jgi:coatomer protein complex subunit gamma
LFIKEMKVKESEVFMVIGSLTKDITSSEDMYRANALVVISKIIDPQNIAIIEKHIKVAIVSSKLQVSRSAQIAGIILYKSFPDIVKKWSNELYEKLNSTDITHLTVILCKIIRNNDNLALLKMFELLIKKPYKNQILLQCQIIRYVKELILKGEIESKQRDAFIQYLKGFLKSNINECISFEAAKSLCELNIALNTAIEGVIVHLENMLESPKVITKYSVLRVLNILSLKLPYIVEICSTELRNSISNPNRCVSSLSMSILLRICKANEVDDLLTNIIKILPDVGDEFKVDMIKSVKLLVHRHPTTYKAVLQFLKKALRPYQVMEFRREILDSIIYIINNVPTSREEALSIAMEFIEDCSFSQLLCKALDGIADEIIKCGNPIVYLKYIYNRILLENDSVRLSAITALGKIGLKCPQSTSIVISLLGKCLHDNSDDVRDKAKFYITLLNTSNPTHVIETMETPTINIESIQEYLLKNQESIKNMKELLKIPAEVLLKTNTDEPQKKVTPHKASEEEYAPSKFGKVVLQVETNPYHSSLTNFIFSTEPKLITEPTAEIQINSIYYIYKEAIVLQLIINNTLGDVTLKNIKLNIELQDLPFIVGDITSLPEIRALQNKSIFILLKKKQMFICGKTKAQLCYKLFELDQHSKTEIGSYEESFWIDVYI